MCQECTNGLDLYVKFEALTSYRDGDINGVKNSIFMLGKESCMKFRVKTANCILCSLPVNKYSQTTLRNLAVFGQSGQTHPPVSSGNDDVNRSACANHFPYRPDTPINQLIGCTVWAREAWISCLVRFHSQCRGVKFCDLRSAVAEWGTKLKLVKEPTTYCMCGLGPWDTHRAAIPRLLDLLRGLVPKRTGLLVLRGNG